MNAAGPLGALAAVVAGILAGQALGPGSATTALVGALVLLVFALVVRGRRGFAIALIGCALLGSAVTQRALHGLEVSPLQGSLARRDLVEVHGALIDDPSGPRFVVEVLARMSRVDGRAAGNRTVLLVGGGDVTSRLRVLEAGDRVTAIGTLDPLTGFDARYKWRHAVARLQVSELVAFGPPTSPLERLANASRGAVLRGAKGLPATERAVLGGFLLGDTRAIPSDLVGDLRDAGLSHLLAVSGANVAFVLAIAMPLLSRLRLGSRLLLGVAILVLFGTMTRWEPSVLRAIAMAGTAMAATFLGRPVPASRILTLAATALLVADPFLIHSVGFLLSCGAAAGILWLGPSLSVRIPGPKVIGDALGVTAAAQIGVLPVLLPVFGTVPLVALPANLLAAPIVGPLTVWGLIAGVAGGVAGPGVTHWLQLPTFALLRWVETVARTAASEPIAMDGRALCGLLAICGVAAALLGSFRLPRRVRD
ncbi:MAG: ComEC/Rec2 family competence protein [Acidimicrobiia bacterium]